MIFFLTRRGFCSYCLASTGVTTVVSFSSVSGMSGFPFITVSERFVAKLSRSYTLSVVMTSFADLAATGGLAKIVPFVIIACIRAFTFSVPADGFAYLYEYWIVSPVAE